MLNKSGFAPIITIIIIAVMSGLSLLAYQTFSKKSSPNSAKINSVTKPTQTPSPNLTAYLSCVGPSGSLGNHVNLVLSGYVPVQGSDGIWGEITDTKLNKTVHYLYGDRYQTNLGVTFQDTVGSIRGEGSLKLYGDSRVYLIKVFNAPYTAGIPTEGTTLVQASANQTCLTYPTPSPKPSITSTLTPTPIPASGGSNDSPTPTSPPTISPTSTPTPTLIPSTPTNTPTPTSQSSSPISVNTTSVNITLSRTNANSGFIYGTGITITSNTAYGFNIANDQGQSGVGVGYGSQGLLPGHSVDVQAFITTDKSNGVYTGTNTIYYYDAQSKQYQGPTISYTITLTD